MFVWFFREKDQGSENLFIETQVALLLKNFFFAPLSAEIHKTRVSPTNPTNSPHHNFHRYGCPDSPHQQRKDRLFPKRLSRRTPPLPPLAFLMSALSPSQQRLRPPAAPSPTKKKRLAPLPSATKTPATAAKTLPHPKQRLRRRYSAPSRACASSSLRPIRATSPARQLPQENSGIQPLPNLETRLSLAQPQAVRQQGKRFLRRQRAQEGQRIGFPAAAVQQDRHLASLQPKHLCYAPWFDPKYMFDITAGFGIALSNPTYIQSQKTMANPSNFTRAPATKLFAKPRPLPAPSLNEPANCFPHSFLSSNKWLRSGYGKTTRQFLATQTSPKSC